MGGIVALFGDIHTRSDDEPGRLCAECGAKVRELFEAKLNPPR
jgi:hypothetical protein